MTPATTTTAADAMAAACAAGQAAGDRCAAGAEWSDADLAAARAASDASLVAAGFAYLVRDGGDRPHDLNYIPALGGPAFLCGWSIHCNPHPAGTPARAGWDADFRHLAGVHGRIVR